MLVVAHVGDVPRHVVELGGDLAYGAVDVDTGDEAVPLTEQIDCRASDAAWRARDDGCVSHMWGVGMGRLTCWPGGQRRRPAVSRTAGRPPR